MAKDDSKRTAPMGAIAKGLAQIMVAETAALAAATMAKPASAAQQPPAEEDVERSEAVVELTPEFTKRMTEENLNNGESKD